MRKLTAWEGPITIVDEEYDGYFVSPEFPTFTLNQHFIEPSYMRLICQTPETLGSDEEHFDRNGSKAQTR